MPFSIPEAIAASRASLEGYISLDTKRVLAPKLVEGHGTIAAPASAIDSKTCV